MSLDVYPPVNSPEWWFEVGRGNITGVSVVHKFGRHYGVGTSFVPVSIGGMWPTPQVAGATTVRVKAGNVNDTAAGTGARKVIVFGVDETGVEVSEELITAGTSASSATATTFMRLYRAYVTESGTYAAAGAGSHEADIVIENGAGGTDWLTIDATDFPRGQSEVGAYTIPLGKTGYITYVETNVTTLKEADLVMFQRRNILETAPPYTAMREILQIGGVQGAAKHTPLTPMGPFPALTDLEFRAKAAVSSEVDVNFEIILVDE